LNIRTPFLAVLLGFASCLVLAGEAYKQFPGAPLDERTMRTQERVEELYQQGEFARALMIFEEDLAPKGDKYAQYTIGYMHLNGQGTSPNSARALAWYRLAAERGAPALVEARDSLSAKLTAEEIAESSRIFAELWKKMGDNRILLDLILDDLSILKSRTGTRIPGAASGPLTVIDMSGSGAANERFYQEVEERLQTRLAYLKTNVEIIDIDTSDRDPLVQGLEDDMKKVIASLELP
jgi:Sel1 repeat